MVLLDFTIYPLGQGESVSPYVTRALAIIEKSGLNYRLHPMGTVLEGSWDECMAVVTKCFKDLEKDCGRVEVAIKVDYRSGQNSRLDSKIESVEKQIGHKLKT